jgi:hypothetical protein
MIKLLDSNRYEMKGTNGRFVHLATMQDGIREYVCMYDLKESKCYIEEISGGQLKFIDDDNVAADLADFLFNKHITDLKYGLPVAD